MINDIIADVKQRMQKSMESLKTELTKLRTGRAHTSLLDHVKVESYGNYMPLNQVATINVENSRTLTVTPWDKGMVGPIEKAIMTAELGLNPSTAGTVIRVPLPALTEERRKDLTKVVREEAERARVSVRNIRREANNDVKELLKAKDITEDDERRAETAVQKITDEFIAQIDKMAADKEKDLMAI